MRRPAGLPLFQRGTGAVLLHRPGLWRKIAGSLKKTGIFLGKTGKKYIAKVTDPCYNTVRVQNRGALHIGMSPSGKAPDFDSGIRRFKSCHPSQFDPLAQLAEQLPFKQWVRGSNPRRVTKTLKALRLSGFLLYLRTNIRPAA